MSKVAVVFWSGTGNTELMAKEVAKGAESAGAEVSLLEISKFDASQVSNFDAIAFGCPAMGAECLEESEFEPTFDDCKPALKDKKVALFGSYDWGDGEWMRNWEDSCKSAGISLVAEGLIVNNTPDGDGEESCKALGKSLA